MIGINDVKILIKIPQYENMIGSVTVRLKSDQHISRCVLWLIRGHGMKIDVYVERCENTKLFKSPCHELMSH